MPGVYVRNRKISVFCPEKGLVNIRECYGCPFYLFRNDNFLVCTVDLERKFGENAEVVSKNPIVIKDKDNNYWIFAKNKKGMYMWMGYDPETGEIDEERHKEA